MIQENTSITSLEKEEEGNNTSLTPLDKKDTVTVLRDIFEGVSVPTPTMRDALERYRRIVITKEAAYTKR